MPLLDAALAFCLTMLAVASLSSQILNWLDKWRNVRSAKLKQMLVDFATRQTYQAVRRAEGYATDQGQRIQTRLVTRLRHFEEDVEQRKAIRQLRKSIGKTPMSQLDDDAKAWVHSMGLADLVSRIDVENEVSIGSDELIAAVQSSSFFAQLSEDASEKVDTVLDEISTQWNQLERRYVAAFRYRAQVINTLLCLAIAFSLNIDALHVLNVYMEDEASRDAVVAQQSSIVGGASREDPPTLAEIQQQARSFEEPAFPVGWDQFPNCPPNSVDSRCLGYWQRAVGSLDVSTLSYSDRLAINPIRYPLTALRGSVGEPRDGEDAGLARTRMAAQAKFGDQLPPITVLGWLGGCLITALLGGLGSPFWFEIVRRLATARENMRRESLETVGHVSAHAEITPANAAPTQDTESAPPGESTTAEPVRTAQTPEPQTPAATSDTA